MFKRMIVLILLGALITACSTAPASGSANARIGSYQIASGLCC